MAACRSFCRMARHLMARARGLVGGRQEEQKRLALLQPYLVQAPKHGVIGNSKYAKRLRKQIVQAARDPDR
jgi:transcriptional regulator with AAA-type ATPase domain